MGCGPARGCSGFSARPTWRRACSGLPLRVHLRSFFQANRFLFEPLARRVLDLLPGRGRALDLYAGVGLFALPLAARDGGEVVAVEPAPTAVRDAESDARRNHLEGVRVVRQDVATALVATRPASGERIVLDPPRSGLERDVVELGGGAPARDRRLRVLRPADPGAGSRTVRGARLRPDSVEVFDLFPDTFHLETVVRLRPA